MKRLIAAILSACLMLSMCACSGEEPTADSSAGKKTGYVFSDSLGNEIALGEMPGRVAILLGSYAEAWLLAGGEMQLVAVTQDAFDERGLELDAAVSNLGQSHEPNLETLLAAQPDFVILSADLDGQLALEDSRDAAGIPTAWFKVETIEDYRAMLQVFTDLTGREDLYEKNGLNVQERITRTIAAVPEGEGPTLLLLRAFSSNVKAKTATIPLASCCGTWAASTSPTANLVCWRTCKWNPSWRPIPSIFLL